MHDQSKSVLEYFYSLATAFVIGTIGFHCIEYMLRPTDAVDHNLVSKNSVIQSVAVQSECVDCEVLMRQSTEDSSEEL